MNHGHSQNSPVDLGNPTGSPQQLAVYKRANQEQGRKKSLESFATSSLKTASAQRIAEGWLQKEKKHIQNYLLTNDAENVMNKYPFLDLLL